MGQFPHDWEAHIKSVTARSYNMVHFTPMMERGESNSPYSISNQLKFDPGSFPNGEKDISSLVRLMEEKYGLLSLTDVVWNHTSNSSIWLEDHPEAGYNLETAPWLESALELDTALLAFSNALETYNLPTAIESPEDLKTLINGIKTHVLEQLRIWEYYVMDVKRDARTITDAWLRREKTSLDVQGATSWPLKRKSEFLRENGLVGYESLGPRFQRTLDPRVGATLLFGIYGEPDIEHAGAFNEASALKTCCEVLDELNLPNYREYDGDVSEILTQLYSRIKYLRLDDHGPKLGPITVKNPLIETYFTRLPKNARTARHDPRSLALVNNGWIWNADALVDHAGSTSKAYLRREVIVWMDCVKLRYGDGPESNPYLWDHMTQYSRLTAKYFSGFRIDNCHTTPIVAAEYFLDQARQVRPDLYVCAELFTGSEPTDYVFVERLGLSSLVREAMQAWSVEELSRQVHRHGGRPIGSFEIDEAASSATISSKDGAAGQNGFSTSAEAVHQIQQANVHAMFMDCTHDNQPPAQKRDARDTLPNAALIAMCACATGSVMGYDEIFPAYLDLVNETRQYASAFSDPNGGADGIAKIKKILNEIHIDAGQAGFEETFIDHQGQFITVHRLHPKSRKGYFLVAHTAFPDSGDSGNYLGPTHLKGTRARSLGSWQLQVDDSEETKRKVLGDASRLRGLPSRIIDLDTAELTTTESETIISFSTQLPRGSIALFETWIPIVDENEDIDLFAVNGAQEAFRNVNLLDLNFILYRCEPEERDVSDGRDGVYDLPGYGPLVYAGLQGWISVLNPIIKNNDLGHTLCQHLRDGHWALDFIVHRMDQLAVRFPYLGLREPTKWLQLRFGVIRQLPNFLLPRYFALVVQGAFNAAWARGLSLMEQNIRTGQPFLQRLAMVSVQQTGYMRSASLYPTQSVPCLAAGLPHFSSSWARCWGRDVFISLRGLFLSTGRYDEAKAHILAFASVLKHGMIPNLLSDGKAPRYNARDAIWFFLQALQDYTVMAPSGLDILKERVKRRFLPNDDTWFEFDDPRAYSKSSTVAEIVQEAVQRHAHGIQYEEANAGPDLDMQMKPDGFFVSASVDWESGILFGGNQSNCGTWQDKMGESARAGSKGIPGTPRDGAAIEITGLLYSTLVWLTKLQRQGVYSHNGVSTSRAEEGFVSFADWSLRIKRNFESCYYIPQTPDDDHSFDVNPCIINRRGIYKDLYRSGKEYEDYQLRANFPIAMAVAPDLFDPERALSALQMADDILRGKTGMATLDPSDMNYRPYYNNSEDSTDFATSKGRNYHQGPEWLWPTGYFLRALLYFDLKRRRTEEGRTESFQHITRRLEGCKRAILESPWAGLTELTNKNGEYCADSSPTQAWSAGCLIDLFHDASQWTNR
ncbi:MAG: hypothetical protein M1825_004777 [Sarcosagium campestre]|nr:MAG: hypothetical protein M1825_004777 [Sarcosagium campestre]